MSGCQHASIAPTAMVQAVQTKQANYDGHVTQYRETSRSAADAMPTVQMPAALQLRPVQAGTMATARKSYGSPAPHSALPTNMPPSRLHNTLI
eukprot:CAMPEP_0202860180 /NCGR_PEP_ID=MMETSP1391-20130828/2000_1 /ASSEMBLY_ACC=CAM_ASM_000867 /TAXON_ID=1034604 /ORGANISM="Chlamydomonas leiostraca, Strain SAG 11-49" /LENGTH=92 /DNA_ID=CAMNT_0049539319 /DNA_START=288 /DNA_END=566 /DNA_ORIENTATION=-